MPSGFLKSLQESLVFQPGEKRQWQWLWWMDNVHHLCRTLHVCAYSVPQLCPTFCNPTNCSLPGSSVHRIFPARTLEWVCHFIFQGIFLAQEPKLHLLVSCIGRRILYHRATWESPISMTLKTVIISTCILGAVIWTLNSPLTLDAKWRSGTF